ncbi:hypothetical protein BBJ29_010043 [Phytophthora kernoviae]|uniref:Cas12f1-like TNB domain-containing protein n=1 Tax=Phytophthora kernoviae TaxID=325452 RepID=A0A3F2RAV9_9STRA|nr:hypothetical protein BBJ29_010043 [Phytophthora kernoviae]RLN50299.1 hypothetical protein BBP00_00010061 [Phytophthora kernoviae]
MSQPQMFTSDTPSKPAQVPYAVQADVPVMPASKDLEIDDEFTRGQWAVGFWDCFTDLMPNCFMVTCCSCISMAQISARLGVTTFSTALIACLAVVIAEFVVYGLASSAGSSSSATVETSYAANGQTTYNYSTNDGGAAAIVYRGISVIIRVVFALFFKMLVKYKMDRVGKRVVKWEEEYRSKTCFSCGGIKSDLGGSSMYKCSFCHAVHDRDVNTAKNIFHKHIQILG